MTTTSVATRDEDQFMKDLLEGIEFDQLSSQPSPEKVKQSAAIYESSFVSPKLDVKSSPQRQTLPSRKHQPSFELGSDFPPDATGTESKAPSPLLSPPPCSTIDTLAYLPKTPPSPSDSKLLGRKRCFGEITNLRSSEIGQPRSKTRVAKLPKVSGWRLRDMSLEAQASRRASRERCRAYTRCIVTHVSERKYTRPGPRPSAARTEKVLELRVLTRKDGKVGGLQGQEEDEVILALLRDEWIQNSVREGDIVHLVGQFEDEGQPLPRFHRNEKGPSSGGSILEVSLDDDQGEDDSLWAEFGSQPLPSQSQLSQSEGSDLNVVRTMILSSHIPQVSPPSSSFSRHADNLLIHHPDILVPSTKVSDVPNCLRRPIIQDKLRSSSDLSIPLVMGSMLHEVLQACLTGRGAIVNPQVDVKIGGEQEPHRSEVDRKAACLWPNDWLGVGNFSHGFVEAQIKAQVQLNIENLFSVGLDALEAEKLLWENAEPFSCFARIYLGGNAVEQGEILDVAQEAVVQDSRSSVPVRIRIDRVLDVEEEIWSPMYGLKGKVDVSVEVDVIEAEQDGRGGGLAAASVILQSANQPPCNNQATGDFKNHNVRRAFSSASNFNPRMESSQPPRRSVSGCTSNDSKKGAAPSLQKPLEGLQIRRSVSVMPLEIKTGRSTSVMEHRAQTMLYTLMMSDRYGQDVDFGLLYYSKTGEMQRVRKTRNEVRGLIIGRNEIAGYMSRRPGRAGSKRQVGKQDNESALVVDIEDLGLDGQYKREMLPPSINDARKCAKCYAVDGCMLYRRVNADVDQVDEQSPIRSLYASRTSHLTQAHVDFFKKWEELLSLEEGDSVRVRKELWTMSAREREEKGRCFNGMVLIQPGSLGPELTSPNNGGKVCDLMEGRIAPELALTKAMNKLTYRFARRPESTPSDANVNPRMMDLLSGHISKNDPVTISIEPSMLSVAQGFVTDLTPTTVEVGLDHSLQAALQRSAEERGLLDISSSLDSTVFRIDKDELSSGMGKIRFNLARLFLSGDLGDERRRELIVDLVPPRFSPIDPNTLEHVRFPEHLNPDQIEAMKKVLAAQDYALILGMPGTGKTTTVAELIKLLTKQGKSVLLTSYTHSAVDTILRKLIDQEDVKMMRLGNTDKVHEDILPYTLQDQALSPSHRKARWPKATSVAQLEQQILSPQIVATTCLSISHPIFQKRKFDYCIVDEASQITLPTCIGPLRFADKFVLVGDHFQLPPLVKSPEAKDGGLDVSLFKRLSDHCPEALCYLSRQYRMNEEIMQISNHLIYGGRLKCGDDKVSKLTLELPKLQTGLKDLLVNSSRPPSPCMEGDVSVDPTWLRRVLSPECKVIFLDTDGISAREDKVGELVQNRAEAQLVIQLCEALIDCGVDNQEIGIVTPYRQQIKLLSGLLESLRKKDDKAFGTDDPPTSSSGSWQSPIEIFTADQSQGRDKSVIILSLVRSNESGHVGQLLNDWRRLNVAFTRARKKLILFGSRETLEGIGKADRFGRRMDPDAAVDVETKRTRKGKGEGSEILRDFFNFMDGKGWVVPLKRSEGGRCIQGKLVEEIKEGEQGQEEPGPTKALSSSLSAPTDGGHTDRSRVGTKDETVAEVKEEVRNGNRQGQGKENQPSLLTPTNEAGGGPRSGQRPAILSTPESSCTPQKPASAASGGVEKKIMLKKARITNWFKPASTLNSSSFSPSNSPSSSPIPLDPSSPISGSMKPSTTGGNANPSGSCFPSESLSENGNKPKPTSPPISRCSSNQGRKQPKQGPPLIDPIISTLEEKKKKKKTNTMSDQVGVGNAAHSKEGENHASESLKNTKVKKLRRGFGSDRLFFGDRP